MRTHTGFAVGLNLVISFAAVASLSTSALAQPIVVEDIVRTTPGGIARGSLATIDLTDPRVQILVTSAPSPAPGGGADANLQTVPAWRTAVGADLAVNANFFSTITGSTADAIGLWASAGTVVSPPRQYGRFPDPALLISLGNNASIGYIGSSAGVWNAVAGVGPSATDADPGTMLITDGVNTGATARVDPANRNPRTAVAVNAAGTTLYILEIDGRLTNWSVGMTLPEVADLLLLRGAWRAVNLDGGGSSSFIYKRPDNTIFQNRPSDGSFRTVATHLGVKLLASAATDRTERPIRGVWIRPPSIVSGVGTSGSFENICSILATAGIQDIFLETFYWGLATNNSQVYNDRFGYDYLAQAIVVAAKYSMRVHAWCEVGYQGFGTTGDYLLSATGVGDQNGRSGDPNWRVLNISNGTIFGDGTAGQMFVNLAHPGVQARLSEFMAELGAYPGLAGVQLDYCRFPVDNNTGDVYPGPWSYDTWTRAQFQADGFGDPLSTAARSSGPNSSQWTQFVTWRRGGITNAVVNMFAGFSTGNAGGAGVWSAAIFPDPFNSAQTSKMQDWPSWIANNALGTVVPMCYSNTQTNIRNELNAAITNAGSRRIAAGLAYPGETNHPDLLTQLGACTSANRRIEDFVWFEYSTFTTKSNAATYRAQLKNWIDTTSTAQIGDINRDGYIDARDRAAFNILYNGTPIATTPGTLRYDLNSDNVINSADQQLFNQAFIRFHFGEDGVVDGRDLQALLNSFTPGSGSIPQYLNLWDLNGDGAVNYADQLILHGYLTVPQPPDLDVNRDGTVNINDIYAQIAAPIDVNRNGLIQSSDTRTLVTGIRAGESQDMAPGR